MTPKGPPRCPRCAGALDLGRTIERTVRYGNDVAIVDVTVDSCQRCGETLLHPGMTDKVLAARRSLEASSAAPVLGRVFDLRSA